MPDWMLFLPEDVLHGTVSQVIIICFSVYLHLETIGTAACKILKPYSIGLFKYCIYVLIPYGTLYRIYILYVIKIVNITVLENVGVIVTSASRWCVKTAPGIPHNC